MEFNPRVMDQLHWQRLLAKLSATATRKSKIEIILSL
jgi:hypothetical protein